jgi:putative transcriptional regulator
MDGGGHSVANEVKGCNMKARKRKEGQGKATCADCGGAVRFEQRPFRYRFAGGLSVTIENATVMTCSACGGESVAIHAPARLHRVVAAAVVKKSSRLTPEEVAFLRHHLDMTGEQLAKHLGVSKTSVSRWETGREPIGRVPDRLLRTLVLLRDWQARPSLALFAQMGESARASHIKVKLQGADWKAAA